MTGRIEMMDVEIAELEKILVVAEQVADAAAAVAKQFFRTVIPSDIKDDLSPVTEADRRIEKLATDMISAVFPDHGIVGEEYGARNENSDWCWVLDPIDGTRAFITGRPLFGMLLGVIYRGRPVFGIIDQPVLGERWIGMSGRPTVFRGAFGGEAGTRKCATLAVAELSSTSPECFSPMEKLRWDRLANSVRRRSWGGDCYAFGLLALGQIDVIAEADLKLWDWVALQPVIEGAGGALTDWEGRPLRIDGDGRVLAVGDQALLAEAVAALAQ